MFLLTVLAGCVMRPSLEELEDDAITTGEWSAVERREELEKERLEASGPGCLGELNKYCVEDSAGCPDSSNVLCTEEVSNIICYCLGPLDPNSADWEFVPDN